MTATTATTKAIGYVRVSTDKQADGGVSLDVQREQIAAYAKLYGITLVDVVQDVASAGTINRPGLQYVLDRLKRGEADAIIVAKLDRLTRSVVDVGNLVDTIFSKAALLSVGEQIDTRSATGRLIVNVISSFSQWEREAIGERTRAAMRHKRAKGEKLGGGLPYGYGLASDGGPQLVPLDDEQESIRMAKELRAGGRSLRAVSRRLALRGRLARNGRPFTAEQIRRMCAGPIGAIDDDERDDPAAADC